MTSRDANDQGPRPIKYFVDQALLRLASTAPNLPQDATQEASAKRQSHEDQDAVEATVEARAEATLMGGPSAKTPADYQDIRFKAYVIASEQMKNRRE